MSENKEKPVSEKKTGYAVYNMIRGLSHFVFRVIFPVRYSGLENVQGDKPYILLSNHMHALDPVAETWKLKKTHVIWLGKKELAKGRFGTWFCRQLHMIPVDRHNTDLSALRSCMKVVRSGGVLGIFPEGTRNRGTQIMSHVESGAALIALRSKAPIQPVLVDKAMKPFRVTHIMYGKRMDISDLYEQGVNTETVDKLIERIRNVFSEMQKQIK